MKEVNSYGWKAVIGSSIGYAMDGFDLLILGFMLTLISGDLGLTTGQAGSLVTWTLVGAVLGGFIFGTLSDKFGRVRVLTWTIVLFAVFTGLCAFAQGYWDLLIYRTIAGIGLVVNLVLVWHSLLKLGLHSIVQKRQAMLLLVGN